MKPFDSNVKRWFVGAVLLVMVGIGVCVYLGVSAIHAEKTLHAINLVTVVVDRFVQQEKCWPKSWDDLHAVKVVAERNVSAYRWPDDAEIVQEFVTINFDADLNMVASQTVKDFDAIEPIGSHYPYKDYGFVGKLIENAKALVDGHRRTPPLRSASMPNRLSRRVATLNLLN